MNTRLGNEAWVHFEPGPSKLGVDMIRVCYDAAFTPCATHVDDDADKRMERAAKVNVKAVLRQARNDIDGDAARVTGDTSYQDRLDAARDYIVGEIGDVGDEAGQHLAELMSILNGQVADD